MKAQAILTQSPIWSTIVLGTTFCSSFHHLKLAFIPSTGQRVIVTNRDEFASSVVNFFARLQDGIMTRYLRPPRKSATSLNPLSITKTSPTLSQVVIMLAS